MCSKLDLESSEQVCHLKTVSDLRRPFARCKSLDASLDRSIDQALLRYITWICLRSNKREHDMDSFQCLHQAFFIRVVCLQPLGSRYSWERIDFLWILDKQPIEIEQRIFSTPSWSTTPLYASLLLRAHLSPPELPLQQCQRSKLHDIDHLHICSPPVLPATAMVVISPNDRPQELSTIGFKRSSFFSWRIEKYM